MKVSKSEKVAAWRDLVFVLLLIWLPRIHVLRMKRRLRQLAELERAESEAERGQPQVLAE